MVESLCRVVKESRLSNSNERKQNWNLNYYFFLSPRDDQDFSCQNTKISNEQAFVFLVEQNRGKHMSMGISTSLPILDFFSLSFPIRVSNERRANFALNSRAFTFNHRCCHKVVIPKETVSNVPSTANLRRKSMLSLLDDLWILKRGVFPSHLIPF